MVCDSGPAIISGTRAGLVEQVPAFWKISLKKLCFDNESVVKKMNQTDMRERAQKEGWQWWEAAFGYNGLIVVLISKSFVKITSANSARHIVSPQGILAIILSLFLTPQYLDSYYSPGLECTSSGRFMSCNFFKARLKPCLLLSFVCFILLHYACPHPRNQQCSDLKVFEDIWHSITCIFVTSLDTLI